MGLKFAPCAEFFKTLQGNAKVTVSLLTDNSLKKPIHLVKQMEQKSNLVLDYGK